MFSMAVQIALSLARRVRIKSLLIVLACSLSFSLMRFLEGLGYEMPDALAIVGLFSLQLLLALTILVVYHTTEFAPVTGFPSRMYTLPARTSLLVSAQMVAGVLAAILVYLGVAAAAWIILGAKWPLLGPSLFLAVFLAWNMAMMWFAPGLSIAKAPPAMLIWGALLVWVGRRYGIDSLPMNPSKMWAHVTGAELLTMTLLGAGAWALAVAGVTRDRRGDSPELKKIRMWLEQEVVGPARRDRDFAGPTAAQMWFEMRTKGHLIPGANAVMQSIIATVYLCGARRGSEAAGVIIAALVVPVCCPYFVGMLAGSCSSPSDPRQMDSFRAIRPMSSAALAHVMLRNGGLSVLLTWLGWLAMSALLVVYLGVTGQAAGFLSALAGSYDKIGPGRLISVVLAVGIFSWTAMALGASNAMSDRRWTPWIPRVVVLAVALPVIYFHAKGMIAPSQYVALFKIFCWVAGSWCFTTTILAFYRAHHRRLIGSRTVRLSALGWVMLCLAAGHALSRLNRAILADGRFPPEWIPVYSVVFLVAGLLMLPFAPLATASVNLARSRSR